MGTSPFDRQSSSTRASRGVCALVHTSPASSRVMLDFIYETHADHWCDGTHMPYHIFGWHFRGRCRKSGSASGASLE